jgi:hypothetical protein
MKYQLSILKNQYDQINRYFSATDDSKAAFLLSQTICGAKFCQINITDFIAADDIGRELTAGTGFAFASPALMDTIDMAMESCKSILLLYSDSTLPNETFQPAKSKGACKVFQIAYHYLPTGQHACLAFSQHKLYGCAWLPDATTAPMQIEVVPN